MLTSNLGVGSSSLSGRARPWVYRLVDTRTSAGFRRWLGVRPQFPELTSYFGRLTIIEPWRNIGRVPANFLMPPRPCEGRTFQPVELSSIKRLLGQP